MAQSRKKFVELAENRVSRVIQDLRLIGNLSNKSNYEYSDEDVEKIISTLKNEVNKTQKRFESVTSKKKDLFKL
jgi:ABC-type Fe3+-hydroxamate transport system substrate-binding protein